MENAEDRTPEDTATRTTLEDMVVKDHTQVDYQPQRVVID